MLDIKFIRENPDIVKKSIKDRQLNLSIDELITLDVDKRKLLAEVEKLKNIRNVESEEIAKLKASKENADEKITKMKELSQKIKDFDIKVEDLDKKITNFLINIPNIPLSSVPIGPNSKSNKIIKEWGKKPDFSYNPRNHIELGEFLGILGFPSAAKITGSNFSLFIGDGAKLVRALINFMIDLHTKKHKYTEIWPPALVNADSMFGTGQLPKLDTDMYKLRDDELYLIPTAEVPVTNIHRNEIFEEERLPIYYTAYTPCFRREAGSYGKETKGLIRVHQFDKVEMVKFVKPQNSWDELESLLSNAEEVIQLLNIPYRVAVLSTGDLSFAASKCYDIEIWAAGSQTWLEVSGCSNFTDFQARRANIKYREKKTGKLNYVHTLNGSCVAFARLIVCILENYQQKDGTILIPEALQPYMDGQKSIAQRK